jgi:hypothetical protein
MKHCYKCKQLKELSAFHKNKAKSDGYATECKQCRKDKKAAELDQDYLGTRLKERANNLKRMFGMSLEEYDKKLKEQNSVCAICGGLCKSGKRLAVDHNHATGKIRDLLCGNCNGGLGKFLENPELLEKAADYIRKHNG